MVSTNRNDINWIKDIIPIIKLIYIFLCIDFFYEIMLSFADIFLNHRELIPSYLLEGDNNKYENLSVNLKEFELQHGILNQEIFNTRRPITKKYSFYELPTRELISCIVNICKHFQVSKMLEVGAGCGLISSVMNQKNIRER